MNRASMHGLAVAAASVLLAGCAGLWSVGDVPTAAAAKPAWTQSPIRIVAIRPIEATTLIVGQVVPMSVDVQYRHRAAPGRIELQVRGGNEGDPPLHYTHGGHTMALVEPGEGIVTLGAGFTVPPSASILIEVTLVDQDGTHLGTARHLYAVSPADVMRRQAD